MRSSYFYIGIISFIFGVAIASTVQIGFWYLVWIIMLGGMVWILSRRSSGSISSKNLVYVSLVIVAAVLGVIRFEFASLNSINYTYESVVDKQVQLVGVVVREPEARENVTYLYTRVEDTLFLVKASAYSTAEYGDKISIKGIVTKPETFETDLGRVFDYPGYLQAKGVSYIITYAEVKIVSEDQGNIIIGSILKLKQSFMEVLVEVIPEPQVSLGQGLLLGVKRSLGEDLELVFRRTGIIHIVVLSGYNVMLVITFVMYVLMFVLPYRARLLFGVVAILLFALMVGLSATVVRASLMAGLLLVLKFGGATHNILRALMLVGLGMILLNPYILLFDPGFQLSFLATLALILVAPHVEKVFTKVPTFIGMREFLVATIATQLFVTPLLLYQIGELSIIAVVVNVLVLPMVPVAMLLTFFAGILGFVSVTLGTVVGYGAHLSLSYILSTAEFFSQFPFAVISVPGFSFWIVVVSYVFAGLFLYRLSKKKSKEIKPDCELQGWIIEDEKSLK